MSGMLAKAGITASISRRVQPGTKRPSGKTDSSKMPTTSVATDTNPISGRAPGWAACRAYRARDSNEPNNTRKSSNSRAIQSSKRRQNNTAAVTADTTVGTSSPIAIVSRSGTPALTSTVRMVGWLISSGSRNPAANPAATSPSVRTATPRQAARAASSRQPRSIVAAAR